MRELNRYISEFEDRDLVYQERMIPELEYAFKHALTQEATYQSILERKRKEFHYQVAQGIERLYQERLEEYYVELAEHYSKSDDINKAIEYMLKVGEKAKRNYANETAISYYQGVLDMIEKHGIDNNEWKLEALKNIGDIYSYAGRITEAVKFLEEAITLAQDMNISPRQLAKLYNLIGVTFWWQSEDDKMVQCGEKILAILGDDDKCLEAVLGNSWIALGSSNNDRYKECINKNMELIKNIEYSPELRAIYDHIICFYNYFVGDLETALNWCNELKKHAEIHNDLRALATAFGETGDIMSRSGNLNEAIQLQREGINIYKQIDDNVHTIVSRVFLDGLLLNLGELEELKVSSSITLNMYNDSDPKFLALDNFSTEYIILSNISIYQRLWDDAIKYRQKYIEIQERGGNQVSIEWSKFWLGDVYMRKGDYDEALEIFHNFADKAFEFQDNYAQYRLFNSLEKLEYTYKRLGKYDEFLNFCKDYRQKHAEAVKDLPLQQWYLEPSQIDNKLSNLVFSDDLNKDMDSSWTWIDIFSDCHYEIRENGLEIHAENGRDLYWPNKSAPRFIREITDGFAVQVCISPATNDKPQMGGIFIWKDDKNYICFERGRNDPYGFLFFGYINGEQKMAGRGLLIEESESTYLRLERNGNEISAYCSIDNDNWLTCGRLSFPVDPIQVGIYAHGIIDRTIYCGEYREGTATLFKDFRIWTKE